MAHDTTTAALAAIATALKSFLSMILAILYFLYNKAQKCIRPESHVVEEPSDDDKKLLVDDLVCPITLELPFDPVMAKDGQIYERRAIEDYFTARADQEVLSPITNEPMGTELVSAMYARNHIQALIESDLIDDELAASWNQKKSQKEESDVLLRQAEAGDEYSANEIVNAYLVGNVLLAQDRKKCFIWAKRAHETGDFVMTGMMGNMLAHGVGVKKDSTRGVMLIALAAAEGSDVAAYLLGKMLCDGTHGLEVDLVAGRRWLEKSLSNDCASRIMTEVGKKATQKKLAEALAHEREDPPQDE